MTCVLLSKAQDIRLPWGTSDLDRPQAIHCFDGAVHRAEIQGVAMRRRLLSGLQCD